MLTTALVADTEIASYNEQLMTNLLVQEKELSVVAKEKMLIGLRNSDGEIYRIIGTSVAQSYNNAIEELIDLDMTNELEDEPTPQNGFMAIFSEQE